MPHFRFPWTRFRCTRRCSPVAPAAAAASINAHGAKHPTRQATRLPPTKPAGSEIMFAVIRKNPGERSLSFATQTGWQSSATSWPWPDRQHTTWRASSGVRRRAPVATRWRSQGRVREQPFTLFRLTLSVPQRWRTTSSNRAHALPSLNSLPPPGAHQLDLCVCAGAQLVGVAFPLDVLSGAMPLTFARLTKSSPQRVVTLLRLHGRVPARP